MGGQGQTNKPKCIHKHRTLEKTRQKCQSVFLTYSIKEKVKTVYVVNSHDSAFTAMKSLNLIHSGALVTSWKRYFVSF